MKKMRSEEKESPMMRVYGGVLVMAGLLALPAEAVAQTAAPAPPAQAASAQPGGSAADLAKQLSNPLASLVSVPFQFNWDQPVGPYDDSRFIMNVQPVIPMALNDDWNLILRWIMPYVGQPPLAEGGLPATGLGDIVASMFFSPAKVGRFIWGVGPVLQLPTNANPALGSGKWSAGPSIVVLKQTGPWTYGMLFNQLWSFAGSKQSGLGERGDVSASLLQPFLAYTTETAVTLSINSEAAANWRLYDRAADGSLEPKDGSQWTVPVHFQVSKVTTFGPFPFSVAAAVGVFAAAPNDQPSWRLRVTGTIMLPRR